MKKRFDEVSYEVCKLTTQKYSSSFSLGILSLDASIRPAIYAIYGYARLADEIVDSFHQFNKPALLDQFKQQTYQALQEGISLNPILHAFQLTVAAYSIELALINQFLASMEMDLHTTTYTTERYKQYIVGSAEVVGLMCLRVFTVGNKAQYEQLKPYAMQLGSAFQKVNFLRDVKDDYSLLGRTYFPHLEMAQFNDHVKSAIEKEIEEEFEMALVGIKALPVSARFGVFLAYKYYLNVLHKIKKSPAQKLLAERIRIPNGKKVWLMVNSYLAYKSFGIE